MNNNLLLKRSVKLPDAAFLNFLHPHFAIIDNLSKCIPQTCEGIIYIGPQSESTVSKLDSLTDKWIIVSNTQYDLDLSTNEGLVKNLLPIHYIKMKSDAEKKEKRKSKKETNSDISYMTLDSLHDIDYNSLVEKVKVCLIDSSRLTDGKFSNKSVYNLYEAILCIPDVFNEKFFNLVDESNIHMVTSSILTFLSKVQTQNISSNTSVNYSRLIMQSNRRYGKHIKKAVSEFVASKTNSILSLYNLLSYLNRAR